MVRRSRVVPVVVLLRIELRGMRMHRHHVRRQRRAGVHRDHVRRVRMLRVVVVVVDLRRLRVLQHVRRRGMRRRRFELTNIAAGDEEDIEVKPQVLFRGERLAIAQSIARYFDVLDIKVGKDSQLAATGPLTGEAFETRAVGCLLYTSCRAPRAG